MAFGKRGERAQEPELPATQRRVTRGLFSYIGRPPWLPIYDFDQMEARAHRECPFGSGMMEGQHGCSVMIGELSAVISICDAFNGLNPKDRPPSHKVISRDQRKLEEIVRMNIAENRPSYVSLLRLLEQGGILEAKS